MFSSLKRYETRLTHDVKRVLLRYLNFGSEVRIRPVFEFVQQLSDERAEVQLNELLALYQQRHFDCKRAWLQHYDRLGAAFQDTSWSHSKKLLLGAYFTHEYSIESAALFNPSIVILNPNDGSDLTRFVMSLRSTGEGHISSISFLSGTIDSAGSITVDPRGRKISSGSVTRHQHEEDYDVTFDEEIPVNSRVLFPLSPGESNGMEDVRLTAFDDGSGELQYIGTYTAYNGRQIIPKMIRTKDFLHFEIRRFQGEAVKDKGMALFPGLVNGKYVMTGRQDGRHSTIMYSDHLDTWHSYQVLHQLKYDWEVLQMGNCGSPVKIPQGWLLLTHAVGPMRRYVISAILLDDQNPGRVIASMDQPLLQPDEQEREGYVPNVLYTCGLALKDQKLIIPYAMSDSAIGFASVDVQEVVSKMKPHG